MNKIRVSWEEIDKLVSNIVAQIAEKGKKYAGIVGIERGGYIPAVMLSHKLGLPLVDIQLAGETLVVDDISDTGETLTGYPEQDTAVLFQRHTSGFKAGYVGCDLRDDSWVVFPWETEESSKYDSR